MTRPFLLMALMLIPLTRAARAEDKPKETPTPTKPDAEERAGEPIGTRATDILEAADAATRRIKSIKYTLHVQRVDVPDNQASKMSGTVIMSGWKDGAPAKFRYEVVTRPGGGTETAKVIVGYDGAQYWALNMRDKKAFAGETMESIGIYQLLVQFFPVTEFVFPSPFGDELNAPKKEYLGPDKVGGEQCQKVYVAYQNPRQKATWYFSTKDHLPRRVDRMITDPDGATLTRSSVITDLVVDPELPDDVFTLVIPSEFVKLNGAVP
jgi:outer membrane lipoprotein-sorting protein